MFEREPSTTEREIHDQLNWEFTQEGIDDSLKIDGVFPFLIVPNETEDSPLEPTETIDGREKA